MSKLIWISAICLGTLLLLVWALAFRSGGSPSYWSFSQCRAKPYYASFANQCKNLAVQAQEGSLAIGVRGGDAATLGKLRREGFLVVDTNQVYCSGRDEKLPPLLRSVHAEFVLIGTNSVYLFVCHSAFFRQDRYGISWERATGSLVISGEGAPVTLFAMTNNPTEGPKSRN